jgi:Spy/CpxP family protein refolding chaperone
MNLKSLVVASCLVVVASWPGGVVRAQQVGAPRGGQPGMRARMGGAAGAGALTPAELERWLDSYILLQAQETLKLTDAQFPRFVQRLKTLQETRRRNLQERRRLVNSLAPLLEATPVDEGEVRQRLKELHDFNIRSAEELRRAYDGIDEVLDPVQQARFRLFEEAAERRKIELLMRARQRGGQQGQPGPAGIR